MSQTVTRGAGAAGLRHPQGDVAGAAGEIEQAEGRLTLRRVHGCHQRVLPGAVQAARHQVVHQVVAARDRMEHVVHQPLLVAPGARFARRNGSRPRCRPWPIVLCGEDHSAAPPGALCENGKSVNHARTARSRNRPHGLRPGHGGCALQKGRGAPAPPALADRQGLREAPAGPEGRGSRPTRQIPAGGPLLRRRAADASRHVGLDAARATGSRSGRLSITRGQEHGSTTMSSSTCQTAQPSPSTIRAASAP